MLPNTEIFLRISQAGFSSVFLIPGLKQKKDATIVTSITEALACPNQRHKKVRPLRTQLSGYVLDSLKLPVSSKEHSKSYVIFYLYFNFLVVFSRFVINNLFILQKFKNLWNYMQEEFLRKLSEPQFTQIAQLKGL